MVELLRSSWNTQFEALLAGARSSLIICSPFIGRAPCRDVCHCAAGWPESFRLLVLTDLSVRNMLSGGTDVQAVWSVVRTFPATEVRMLPSLHAKVYVADETEAIVTSGNLTEGGLVRNFEYGVRFTDSETVRRIRQDVLYYASLGSRVEPGHLTEFASIAGELRGVQQAAEKSMNRRLREEFRRRLRQADKQVLRVRAGGRAPHTIFGQAILYLLHYGPATTDELHRAIQRIHPDLCDDTVDRVIDGKHFGKKWKHAVRTAQQHLKKRQEIEVIGHRWQLRD